ncbi:uncharacterized protein LOC121236097 isoform X2 [Juglans microcarpa x Juglans regia]|uniref:uncharacterized protein LOC121236097 isoform X1 n=1 Tax=Juglans microcarpa x Juglans regia TaxID=2249226 RepID=UPI001B7DE70A|nr:uncharacterized protein LOC121236097 isoform X1 [Juglans microcarpa x Juglans regia]XP_040988528.1 uncharacterized protein LOC121236097 isoform X2 [Juglans microcarpa x Juglans regia]
MSYPDLQHQYGLEPIAIITFHDHYHDPFQSRKIMLRVLSDVPQYQNNLRTFNSKATYQEEDDPDALHINHSKNLTPKFLEKLDDLEETSSDEEADGHIKIKHKYRELRKLRRSIVRLLSHELSK